ncbi:hypothetical protein, partial [Pseudomonas gingeri]|uniref:hypothetical protein n=1 Tax=Pseudomonas gingeri TaxID=117681 RepID=UPI001AE03116
SFAKGRLEPKMGSPVMNMTQETAMVIFRAKSLLPEIQLCFEGFSPFLKLRGQARLLQFAVVHLICVPPKTAGTGLAAVS